MDGAGYYDRGSTGGAHQSGEVPTGQSPRGGIRVLFGCGACGEHMVACVGARWDGRLQVQLCVQLRARVGVSRGLSPSQSLLYVPRFP